MCAKARIRWPSLVLWLLPLLLWAAASRAQEDGSDRGEGGAAGQGTGEGSGEWTLQPPELGGFIQVFYRQSFPTAHDGSNDNPHFRVQRVRINVEGEVLPWLSYEISIDPRAPEVSGILRDAFIGFHVIPHHELRLGQQKTQFGWENRISSSRLYAVNRSEVSDNLSRGQNLRDLGIGLVGDIHLGHGWRIEDAITVVNGAGLNVQDDNTATKNIWGRLGVRYRDEGLTVRVGASGGYGDQLEPEDPSIVEDDFTFDFWRVGADVEVNHDWFFFAAEYVMGQDDVSARTLPEATPAETVDQSGYFGLFVLKTPWEIGPLVRYDALGDEFQRVTFGAYYGSPRETFRVLLNYELRLLIDDVRGDDKLYLWTQVRF